MGLPKRVPSFVFETLGSGLCGRSCLDLGHKPIFLQYSLVSFFFWHGKSSVFTGLFSLSHKNEEASSFSQLGFYFLGSLPWADPLASCSKPDPVRVD